MLINPASAVLYTAATNLTGHPSMSVPVGLCAPTESGTAGTDDTNVRLPVGMMIMGRFWDESVVLRAGDALERALSWRDQFA